MMKKIIICVLAVGSMILVQPVYAWRGEGDVNRKEGFKKGRNENFVQQLDLSEDQQKNLKEYSKEYQQRSQELKAKLNEQNRMLKELFKDPHFDEVQARQIAEQIQMIRTEMMNDRINKTIYMRSILTSEQYQQFFQKMKSFRHTRQKSKEDRKDRSLRRKERKMIDQDKMLEE